ncbi:MAG TPA: phosphoribosylglycinamide formyltransferase [Alphaproteobacteria bacterium]|jgi:phosphoribosylglycinamide formyltransferase-1|nr:phosphoribosylglycinamide formyltransferase [Alphaproteobacteria bacterium]
MAKLKTAILISERGSNMRKLVAACNGPAFPAEVVLVLSNNPDAPGLEHAKEKGLAIHVIDQSGFPKRAEFDVVLDSVLRDHKVNLVCLAGFMRILSEDLVNKWRNRIINIHPSLLPSFKGLNTHARVLQSGVSFSGCTVHFVRPEMDEGPVIVQAVVPVHNGDTVKKLAARVLAAEHKAYPLALRLIAEGRVRLVVEKVKIDGALAPAGVVINPTEKS